MKTMNPWVMIRWALVAVIYAATLAISIDQIREKTDKISAMEKDASILSEVDRSKFRKQLDSHKQDLKTNEMAMELKISALEGQIMVMQAKVDLANSRVENSRKLGYSQAIMDRINGKSE